MNEKITNNQRDENAGISNFLSDISEKTNANIYFVTELEQKLRERHRPKLGRVFPSFKQTAPALGWIALVVAFAFLLNWSIRSIIPNQQPGTENTPAGYVCPVTEPNGSLPPGETVASPYYLGNGQLWTSLWPDGKVNMSAQDRNSEDGSFSMKWGWVRGVSGPLAIEGHRLDAEVKPLRADIPDGYGDTGFQVSGLIFPTTGCWEVTGRVGGTSLTFVTEVVFNDGISTPVVESIATPQINATPVEDNNGYDWRGTKLYLNVPLPEVPTMTNIYLVKEGQPATVEQTRALAEQFGIQGDVYVSKNPATGETEYLVTDGKQSLSMSTGQVYTYTANTARAFNNLGGHTDPNAEATINEFLASHGFDFPHRVATGEFFGGYVVEPLSPEGLPMRYEFFSSRPMKVILDENGQVLQVEANLMDYEQFGTQAYGIISAEEAFQQMMDDNITKGKIESAHSSSTTVQAREWRYVYPKNETITIYGYAYSMPALDPSKPAFNQIDGYTATGNTNGFETLQINSFVQATGLFIEENGIEKFNVDSWKISDDMQDGIVGNLTSENGQVLFQTEQGEQLIIQPDLPSDLPIPYENAFVVGIRKPNNIYEWTLIDDRANDNSGGSGGGGGGGQGFYKLNLSGTPVPFPPVAPTPSAGDGTYIVQENDTLGFIAQKFGVSVDELAQANNLSETNFIVVGQQLTIPGVQTEQTIADLQGLLSIIIQKKTDGTQTTEYDLIVSGENSTYSYYGLEGSGLDQLDAYNGLPIIVSGNAHTENNFTIINVESFTIPYPDLQFQIVRGKQEVKEISGQYATIFTVEGGGSYLELMATSDQVNDTVTGIQGDTIQQEVLIVPNETFYDMPVIRVYQSSIIDAGATPMQINGNRIQVLDDTQTLDFPVEGYTIPTLTIEKVELMYYVTNPHWQVDHLDGGTLYLQPVWRFYGHFDSGGEFEVLVQAFKQEYLLPELDPFIPGG